MEKLYLVHWNIQGMKDTFDEILECEKEDNESNIYCLNEVNARLIKSYSPEFKKGTDLMVTGRAKKTNILVSKGQNSGNIDFIGCGYESFKYRVVKAELFIKGYPLKIITFHSPSGSGNSYEISGSKVKAYFYNMMIGIVKKEKPDIITMDANEPEFFNGDNFRDWVFYDNRQKDGKNIDARVFFSYLFDNYVRFSTDFTYTIKLKNNQKKLKFYDHIFFKSNRLLITDTNYFDSKLESHSSDHKYIAVEIKIIKK